MKGKVIIYGCGGAGINVVSTIKNTIKLNDAFADLTYKTLDTTDKTIASYPELQDNFTKISSIYSTRDLDGMSGERKNVEMVEAISARVKEYVDANIKKNNINEYHILIASASGGSGSIILPLLFKELLAKDVNVIPIVIGDSSTLLHATNTINSLVGLNKIAKVNKVANALLYFSNTVGDDISTPEKEMLVNMEITKIIKLLAMYFSGNLHDIDHQDMRNFLKPSLYKSFTVQPGLYTLAGSVKTLNDPNAILARVLTSTTNTDVEITVPLLHTKIGVARDSHIDVISNDKFPMYLYLQKNILNNTVEQLNARAKKLEEIKTVESSTLDALEDSLENEDGLIL